MENLMSLTLAGWQLNITAIHELNCDVGNLNIGWI